MRIFVSAFLTLLIGCAAVPPTAKIGNEAGGDVSAFVGVTVIPMTPAGRVRADQTVLVTGDRIAAVGDRGKTRVPDGARVIDGRGKYLIPGLADMHVHLEHFDTPDVLTLFLANGVTTVRNMDGRDYILRWKHAVAKGDLPGPTIYTAGPLLDGDPPVFPDNTVVRSADEARSQVIAQAGAGYDFIKVYVNLSPAAYRAVLSAAREQGMPVAGHVPRRIEIAEALRGGQTAIEHLADYGDLIEADDSPFKQRWHWSKLYLAMPIDEAKITEAAAAIAASGVWTVPTMVQANRALAPPETVAEWLRAPEMVHIPAEGRTVWQERVQRTTSRMDADDWALVDRGRANRGKLVRALHLAGARLLAGTDTPNPFVVPGFSIHEELSGFVAAGLDPADAIAAATRDAARFFGDEDEWGSIEVGKRADLVLLDADPLADVRNLERRTGVMARGRWLPAAALEEMVSDHASKSHDAETRKGRRTGGNAVGGVSPPDPTSEPARKAWARQRSGAGPERQRPDATLGFGAPAPGSPPDRARQAAALSASTIWNCCWFTFSSPIQTSAR